MLPLPARPRDPQAVGAVSASGATRSATDAEQQARPVMRAANRQDQVREAGTAVATPAGDHPRHVRRALAAYAGVASRNEREQLNELLGFDTYA